MTDKEKIKQEIERLKEHTAKCGYPGQGEFENGNREGRNYVCDKLLSFIDSLPEESGCEANCTNKNNNLDEALFGEFKKIDHECFEKGIVGFEREKLIAHHFAEWEKEQMMKEAVDIHAGDCLSMQPFSLKGADMLDKINIGDTLKIIFV